MASRNTDINLVIRAKNEADQAIGAVSGALKSLLGGAEDASDGVSDLGQTLASLDKAFGAVSGKADAAAAAFQRQQSALASNRDELAAIVAQAAAASQAMEHLRASIVDEVLAGRDQGPVIAQMKLVQREQDALANQADKLTRTIATQEGALDGSRSALLRLSATVHAVEDAQGEAAARIALTTQALDEQAAAAQRVTAIQQRINDVTGVNRPVATGNAAAAADVLMEADNIFRRTEARTAEIAKLREQEAATAALADAERAEQANRGRFNITDDPRGGQARESASVFTAAAEAEEQMAREAAHLRAELDPLAAIQDRYNASLARYRELAAAGKIGADDLAQAEQRLAAQADHARLALERTGKAGGGGKAGLFGLKPYELQNLGYQVNDVATQLASGTSLAQTLGQQGGQIIQIFPRITSAIVGAFSNPAFLGAAVVLGGIIFGLKRAADEAERLREFSGEVTFRADGGDYNAKGLSEAAEKLDRMGASADGAKAAVKVFLDEGINPDLLDQFGRAAQQTAQRLGTDLPTAAKQVADAFSGGYDAIAEFDNKLNFLTASERAHIRQLFEEGMAQAGRTEALNAYSRQSDATAAKQRGPWADAAKSLGKAWDALVNWIADTAAIKITIGVLAELAGAVKDVGDAIAAVLGDDKPAAGGAAASAQKIAQVQQQIRDLEKTVTDYEVAIAKKSPIAGTLQHVVDITKQQLVTARAELAKLEKTAPDTVNGGPNSAAAKQRTDDLARISVEDELQRLRDAGQSRILSKTEQARRAQLAGEEAARTVADAVVAAAERRRAVAKETAAIERETDARVKSNQADREREIRAFTSRVIGAEGGAGKNPFSTAKGYGQFTERTFKDQFAKVAPERSRTLSESQVLALRSNETVAKAVIDNYARENAKFLESFGAKVTAGNLYLAHFLGAGGAKAVLTANGATPVDQIIRRLPNSDQVLSGNKGYLRTDGGKGRYRTSSELQTFIAGRVGDTGQAQTQAQVAINNLLEDATRKQDEFNLAVRHGAEDRQRAVDGLRAENGLYGVALLAEQRRQAVLQAELDLRQKVEDANKNLQPGETAVVVSPEQIQGTRDLAAAAFDAAHAREALNAALADVQRPLDDLTAQRDLLREQAEYLRSIGENTQADAIDDQFNALGGKIRDAYDALIAFYKALAPQQRIALGILDQAQLDNIIAKLKVAQTQTQEWGKIAGVSARDIAQAFASSAAQSFTNFINKVAAGKNVFKSLAAGVREFAANFISSVAQMILQLLAFAAVVTILRALGVPVPSGASIFDSVGSKHTGGVVGQDGSQRRNVSPMLFAGAQRFHTGGIIGLAPDEMPIIARRGEEVLTEGDPRHRNNIGANDSGSSSQAAPVNIINTWDREEAAEQIMRTKAGHRAILNFISDNPRAVKAALG